MTHHTRTRTHTHIYIYMALSKQSRFAFVAYTWIENGQLTASSSSTYWGISMPLDAMNLLNFSARDALIRMNNGNRILSVV